MQRVELDDRRLSRTDVELALKVLYKAARKQVPMGQAQVKIPKKLRHLTRDEWDNLCLALQMLLQERSRSRVH
jgi:hypothetical protein